MPKEYEFSYQSTKQKAVLIFLKLFVAFLLGSFLYSLGWVDNDNHSKLVSVSSVLTAVWIYSNLLRVKVEVQELFVEPPDILFAKEFMLAGFLIGLGTMGYTIYQIYLLS